jgi:hypothetical protein
MMDAPGDAVWFGLEIEGQSGEWVRIDEHTLGGKWWRVGAVSPEEVAKKAAELVGFAFLCRVHWSPKDKRYKLGNSVPFRAGEADPQPPAQAPPVDHPPAAPEPPQRRQTPRSDPRPPPEAIAAQARLLGGNNGHNGHGHAPPPPPHAPPLVPMPFSPPAPGSALDPLSTFVYVHSLVHQDKLAWQQQVLAMANLMIEGERARSAETIKSMELHYATIDSARRELNQALAQAGRSSPQLEALGTAVAQLGERIEDLQDDDDEQREQMLAKLTDNPSELERVMVGVQNTVAAVANSPLGRPLGEAIARGFGGRAEQEQPPEDDWQDVQPPPQ